MVSKNSAKWFNHYLFLQLSLIQINFNERNFSI